MEDFTDGSRLTKLIHCYWKCEHAPNDVNLGCVRLAYLGRPRCVAGFFFCRTNVTHWGRPREAKRTHPKKVYLLVSLLPPSVQKYPVPNCRVLLNDVLLKISLLDGLTESSSGRLQLLVRHNLYLLNLIYFNKFVVQCDDLFCVKFRM